MWSLLNWIFQSFYTQLVKQMDNSQSFKAPNQFEDQLFDLGFTTVGWSSAKTIERLMPQILQSWFSQSKSTPQNFMEFFFLKKKGKKEWSLSWDL